MPFQNYPQETEHKVSKYNSAVAQLFRLDNLWQQFQYHRALGSIWHLLKANENLDSIFGELSSDSGLKEMDKLNSFAQKLIQSMKSRGSLYYTLLEKEIWLRKLQNAQGKGTAYADPDQDLM